MRFEKPATTVDEQLVRIKERGMIVSDEELATRWLKTVGYYRLAGYWLPFETLPAGNQARSRIFKPNTDFESIVKLYIFDRKLRLILLEGIERIEINVRSRWTNGFALKHGPHGYLEQQHFKSSIQHSNSLAKCGASFQSSKEKFAKHYLTRGYAPNMPAMWMATELMTFTELSIWVKNTKDSNLLNQIARDIGLPNGNTLSGTLEALAYVRNIAAHQGRLWNRETVKRLPMIKKIRRHLISDQTTDSRAETSNKIYNILVIVSLLIKSQAADSTFVARLKEIISEQDMEMLNQMGFPENWQERSIWSNG